MKTNCLRLIAFTFLLATCATVVAERALEQREDLNADKPFAEAHLIMQVSDAAVVHHQAVLDISNNLTKHYGGPDFVDIEVVAFGAGVSLLFANDNANATRISSLMEHGVRFYVCGNTLDTIERKTGQQPKVLPGVIRVQTGVAFLVDEINRGYLHLHP